MNWRDRSSAIDPAVKTWADHAMAWLVGRFGEERLGGEVILPNVECFPEPYDGSRDDARVLLDRVCNYMDIDPQSFALSFFSQRRPMAGIEHTQSQTGAAGLCEQRQGRTMIWLETSRLADPLSVVATFAHELCHVHLLRGRRISADKEDIEPLTDLATVYFGMGVFTANASLRDKSCHGSLMEYFSISRLGYLDAAALAYALALFAWLRRERKPRWAEYLRLDVRLPFRKMLSYLTSTRGAVAIPPETLDDDQPPPYPASLRRPSRESAPVGAAADEERWSEPDAAAADPNDDCNAEAYTRAIVLMHNRQWKEAAEAFSEIIRDDPEDGEAYQQRALAQLQSGAVEDALADAERAVWLLPDDSDSYLVRGRARLRRQSYAGAIADFTRYLAEEDCLAASPARIAGVYYLRGVAHADNGDSGEALADFAISIRRWPHPPEVYEARASVYERLGIIDKARADREEAARRSKSIATEVQGRVSPIPY